MVKKELTNKKVVRAIALGLSAVMLTTPMTAMASTDVTEGGEGASAPEPKEEGTLQVSDVANDAQDAVVDVTDVSDDASKSVADVNSAIDAAKDILPESVVEAAPGTEPDLNKVDTKMDVVDGSLNTAEQSDYQVSSQKAVADSAAQTAADVKTEAETIVADAKTTVDNYTEDIQNATTIDDANKAYEEANKAVEDAKVAFAEKETAYKNAKEAYDEATNKAAEAKATYDAAVKAAADNAADAKAIYDAALAEADVLKGELDKAQSELGDVSAEALDIAKWEDADTSEDYWGTKDELFESIMKGYYLPKVLGIEDNNATVKVKKFSGEDSKNYFTVVYTKDGQTVTEYYNYKIDSGKMVIFEKRDKEVNGGAADQYVDESGNVVSLDNLQDGLADESIRDIYGTYYIEGDKIESDSDVKVEDSTSKVKDGIVTTITNVDVADITDAEPEYTVDEDGNIVKTVKADVTTTISTYVDKTWTDGVLHDSEEDAKAAGKEYVADYTDAINEGIFLDDYVITAEEESVTEYTATGTYIPTFTETVTVSDYEVERYDGKGFLWGALDDGVKTSDEAKAIAKNSADNYFKKSERYKDYYYIESTSDFNVSYTDEGFMDDEDFLINGTVTVTYARIETGSFNLQDLQGILGESYSNLITGKNKNNENLETVVKSYLESQGAIFVSAEWGNGKGGNNSQNGNKATVRYVWRNEITSGMQADEQGAKDSVSGLANDDAVEKGATGAYNVKVTGTTSSEVTKYKYNLAYSERTSSESSTEEAVVLRETYEANELTAQIVQNLNYINKKFELTQDDATYRNFVDSNVNLNELNNTYDALLAKVADAQTKVADAQTKVVELQNRINEMNGTDISDLTKELESAEDALKDALEELGALDGELEEAKDVLDEVIVKLTPVPESGEGSSDGDDDTVAVVTPVPAPVAVEEAPVTPIAVAAAAPAGAGQAAVVDIEDEATPLAAGIGDGNDDANAGNGDDEVIVAEAKEEAPAIVAIEDEETPLAAGVGADGKMPWWWLLIVALLGATGYKMYKDHQKKKEEAQEA